MSKHDEDVVEEKSFNEDELEDIMNEIENLEREFSDEEPAAAPAPKAKSKPAPKAPAPVAEVEEEEVVAQAPVSKVVPMNHKSAPAKSGATHPSSMHLNVSGDMQITLEFGIHGQHVHLSVDPSEGLVISMEGGAKFCLPLSGHKKTGT